MYWFNNQFSELTRSILFPGSGGPGGDNYASFNPHSAPDYHSRLPDSPLSGGNNGPRGRGSYDEADSPVNGGRRGTHGSDYSSDDSYQRRSDRDEFLRDSDEANRAQQNHAPRNPTPRPAETPRPTLPPILSGPLRLPPIFRPPNPSGGSTTPNPSGPLRLPTLPPLSTNPFRRPGGSSGP